MRYRLIDYTDVWGDPEEWTVNDCTEIANDIEISDANTDKEILEMVREKGLINTTDMRRVGLEEHGENIEIVQRKGLLPLGVLQPMY